MQLRNLASEDLFESAAQGDIQIGHGHRQAEVGERGHAVLSDAAGFLTRLRKGDHV
jgi:hypothetical protein